MSLHIQLDEMHRLMAALWSETDHRPGEITYSEYEYLRAVERLNNMHIEGISAHENYQQGHHLQSIVALLGVQKASASTAIAKLEKRGLIERFPCQRDSRAQHVLLTQVGEKILQAEFEAVYRAAAERFSNLLTADELSVFISILSKLIRNHHSGDPS